MSLFNLITNNLVIILVILAILFYLPAIIRYYKKWKHELKTEVKKEGVTNDITNK